MQLSWNKKIVGLAVLLLIVSGYLLFNTQIVTHYFLDEAKQSKKIGHVIESQKSVIRKSAHTFMWVGLKEEQAIYDLDTYSTGKESSMNFEITGIGTINLSENSLIHLDLSSPQLKLNLENGAAVFKFTKDSTIQLEHKNQVLSLKSHRDSTASLTNKNGNLNVSPVSGNIELSGKQASPGQNIIIQPNLNVSVAVPKMKSPKLLYPVDIDLKIKPTEKITLRFRWSDSENAEIYQIIVSNKANFKEKIIDQSVKKNFIDDLQLPEGTYFWKVYGQGNDKNNGIWSATESFKIVKSSDVTDVEQASLAKLHLPTVEAYDKSFAEVTKISGVVRSRKSRRDNFDYLREGTSLSGHNEIFTFSLSLVELRINNGLGLSFNGGTKVKFKRSSTQPQTLIVSLDKGDYQITSMDFDLYGQSSLFDMPINEVVINKKGSSYEEKIRTINNGRVLVERVEILEKLVLLRPEENKKYEVDNFYFNSKRTDKAEILGKVEAFVNFNQMYLAENSKIRNISSIETRDSTEILRIFSYKDVNGPVAEFYASGMMSFMGNDEGITDPMVTLQFVYWPKSKLTDSKNNYAESNTRWGGSIRHSKAITTEAASASGTKMNPNSLDANLSYRFNPGNVFQAAHFYAVGSYTNYQAYSLSSENLGMGLGFSLPWPSNLMGIHYPGNIYTYIDFLYHPYSLSENDGPEVYSGKANGVWSITNSWFITGDMEYRLYDQNPNSIFSVFRIQLGGGYSF